MHPTVNLTSWTAHGWLLGDGTIKWIVCPKCAKRKAPR